MSVVRKWDASESVESVVRVSGAKKWGASEWDERELGKRVGESEWGE